VKHLLVLGAGTAGTMAVAKLRPRLPASEWRITVVDRDDEHHYQPGYLFVPFGTYDRADVVRPRSRYLPEGVDLVLGEIAAIDPEGRAVTLADGTVLAYDADRRDRHVAPPRPDARHARSRVARSVHEFYTLEGAEALRDALAAFDGGRLVAHVSELPVKCPVAPLEFLFLADAHFRDRGIRDRVELVYVTPLDGAFTTPVAAERLAGLLEARGIAVETDFVVERIDGDARRSCRTTSAVPFDLLVTVPVNMGADAIAECGLGDELQHVPVDPGTLQSRATRTCSRSATRTTRRPRRRAPPSTSRSTSFVENFVEHAHGRPMTHAYDGRVNCFVETGGGKALLLDFDYATPTARGRYPLSAVGPFSAPRGDHDEPRGQDAVQVGLLAPAAARPRPAAPVAAPRSDAEPRLEGAAS
jgi:sulfide:quinone oxidoreductase